MSFDSIMNSVYTIIRRFLNWRKVEPEFLQKNENYLESYAHYVDERVLWDPKMAVGGFWNEIGRLQFDFLIQMGLKPDHKMLDVGCGTLRGGRFFIQHLNEGNYYGYDISMRALAYAEVSMKESGLVSKAPVLFHSFDGFRSAQLRHQKFDMILAQSVFTHLPSDIIEAHFRDLKIVLAPSGSFFFTYDPSESNQVERQVDFLYTHQFFQDLAEKYSLGLQDLSGSYRHPRNQKMIRVWFNQKNDQ